jgi:hypothetical protein
MVCGRSVPGGTDTQRRANYQMDWVRRIRLARPNTDRIEGHKRRIEVSPMPSSIAQFSSRSPKFCRIHGRRFIICLQHIFLKLSISAYSGAAMFRNCSIDSLLRRRTMLCAISILIALTPANACSNDPEAPCDVASIEARARADFKIQNDASPNATDFDYVALTVSRRSAWGVGQDARPAAAVRIAIERCIASPAGPDGCGAQFEVTRGNWTVARMCGDRPVIAAASVLADANQRLTFWEISLDMSPSGPLPICQHLVTIAPDGQVMRTAPSSVAVALPEK